MPLKPIEIDLLVDGITNLKDKEEIREALKGHTLDELVAILYSMAGKDAVDKTLLGLLTTSPTKH